MNFICDKTTTRKGIFRRKELKNITQPTTPQT